MIEFLQQLGIKTRTSFTKLGRGTFFLLQTMSGVLSVLPRPRLLLNQMHSIGVLSFLIITISGLFVGMVLGLQGYYTLSDFGAEESWASWLQPLWSGNSARRFSAFIRRPGRFRVNGGNWPDESDRAAVGHGNDGRRPDQAHYFSALFGRILIHALTCRTVQRSRHHRRTIGWLQAC
jgi:Domain of unknown function DUF140.